jgi:hypothetical protein
MSDAETLTRDTITRAATYLRRRRSVATPTGASTGIDDLALADWLDAEAAWNPAYPPAFARALAVLRESCMT